MTNLFEPMFLSLDEVLEIHEEQIVKYGGSPGLRDSGELESAVATPQATYGGLYLHASMAEMAAAYLFHICQNHPFVDGNERTGANAAITFLFMNDWDLEMEEDELVELVLTVASSGLAKADLSAVFEKRCQLR